jgi:hypothetical protein
MREIIQHWWVLALRSGLALALAVTIFLLQAWAKFVFLDGITVPFLIVALAVYGVTDSFLVFYMGMQFPERTPARTISLTQGVCGAGIGVMLLTTYFRTAELSWFIYIITAQAIITGIFEVLTGLRFTTHVADEWACFAAGAASLGFAVWLNTGFDGSTLHALDWFLGYALLLSASMAWFTVILWRMRRELQLKHAAPGV